MSRYFDLRLYRNGQTDKPAFQWTTHPNGKFDPNYPSIQFDIINAGYSNPTGGASIRIRGISLDYLQKSSQFSQDLQGNAGGMQFSLWGGMAQGLPLANPLQNGLLFVGQVYQSFGNWEATGMSLDLIVSASTFDADNNGETAIVFYWQKGKTLNQALNACLKGAFKSYAINVNVANIINQNDDVLHFCNTLEGFASWLIWFSSKLLDPNYAGVHIAITPGQNDQAPTINAFDNYQTGAATPISFNDLIGQPTWIDNNVLQFKTPMRGDITIGSYVNLPREMQQIPVFALSQAASNPALVKYASTFPGRFHINQVRHIGDSRNPSPDAWVTVFNCNPEQTENE